MSQIVRFPRDTIAEQLDDALLLAFPDIMPGYVEFAAQQAVADLIREYGKTKASFLLSKYLEDDRD